MKPYRVDAVLKTPHAGGPWTEAYQVRAERGDRLICECETRGNANRVCRALNLGDAYGKGN